MILMIDGVMLHIIIVKYYILLQTIIQLCLPLRATMDSTTLVSHLAFRRWRWDLWWASLLVWCLEVSLVVLQHWGKWTWNFPVMLAMPDRNTGEHHCFAQFWVLPHIGLKLSPNKMTLNSSPSTQNPVPKNSNHKTHKENIWGRNENGDEPICFVCKLQAFNQSKKTLLGKTIADRASLSWRNCGF